MYYVLIANRLLVFSNPQRKRRHFFYWNMDSKEREWHWHWPQFLMKEIYLLIHLFILFWIFFTSVCRSEFIPCSMRALQASYLWELCEKTGSSGHSYFHAVSMPPFSPFSYALPSGCLEQFKIQVVHHLTEKLHLAQKSCNPPLWLQCTCYCTTSDLVKGYLAIFRKWLLSEWHTHIYVIITQYY